MAAQILTLLQMYRDVFVVSKEAIKCFFLHWKYIKI